MTKLEWLLIIGVSILILGYFWVLIFVLDKLFDQTEIVEVVKWAAALIFLGLGASSTPNRKG